MSSTTAFARLAGVTVRALRQYIAALFGATPDAWERVIAFVEALHQPPS
jgi:hypothetical protein